MLRYSIRAVEQVAYVKNRAIGQFQEIMLIRGNENAMKKFIFGKGNTEKITML